MYFNSRVVPPPPSRFGTVIKENSSNYSEFFVALFNYFTCKLFLSLYRRLDMADVLKIETFATNACTRALALTALLEYRVIVVKCLTSNYRTSVPVWKFL